MLQDQQKVGGQVCALEGCGSSHRFESNTCKHVRWAFFSATVKSTIFFDPVSLQDVAEATSFFFNEKCTGLSVAYRTSSNDNKYESGNKEGIAVKEEEEIGKIFEIEPVLALNRRILGVVSLTVWGSHKIGQNFGKIKLLPRECLRR